MRSRQRASSSAAATAAPGRCDADQDDREQHQQRYCAQNPDPEQDQSNRERPQPRQVNAGFVMDEDAAPGARPGRKISAGRDNLRFGSRRLGRRTPLPADWVVAEQMHRRNAQNGSLPSMWRSPFPNPRGLQTEVTAHRNDAVALNPPVCRGSNPRRHISTDSPLEGTRFEPLVPLTD
jgi:hypothetical protein